MDSDLTPMGGNQRREKCTHAHALQLSNLTWFLHACAGLQVVVVVVVVVVVDVTVKTILLLLSLSRDCLILFLHCRCSLFGSQTVLAAATGCLSTRVLG